MQHAQSLQTQIQLPHHTSKQIVPDQSGFTAIIPSANSSQQQQQGSTMTSQQINSNNSNSSSSS